ncbi:MAG: TonB-dependent receptor [Pseudomonadota bacterium]
MHTNFFKKKKIVIAISLAGLQFSVQSHAQSTIKGAPAKLEPLVIEGKRVFDPTLTQPSINTAKQRLNDIPGGANVIDAERYREGRTSTLSDLLNLSPGVYIQPRFGAEESRLSIRGSGLQRTFHLRGIQLLQDGVPLNQADGGGDFQAVEPMAARYVEVFRGANALQYGATTLGGAINFVSPTGFSASPIEARIEAGSFGYYHGQGSIAGNRDTIDYYASLSDFQQDGFREHAKQNNQRFFGNVGWRFADKAETRFYLGVVESESEVPGNLTKSQLVANPRQANPDNIIGNTRYDSRLWRIANKTTFALSEGRLELSGFYIRSNLFHPTFEVLDIDSKDYGIEARYVSEAPLSARKNILTIGFAPARGTVMFNRFVNVSGSKGARTDESEGTASNINLYAENQHYVLPHVAVVVGTQWSEANRKLNDLFLSDGMDNSFDKTYRSFSPKLGMRYEITPAAQLFANLSKSFEPPSFGELFAGPGISQVSEQTARTIEIGSRGEMNNVRWDVALYHAKVKDELLILNTFTGTPLDTVNAPRTIHQGIEIGLEIPLGSAWELRQTYLLNDFYFDNDAMYGHNRLPGIPRHVYQGELNWRGSNGFYAGPNIHWSPTHYAVDMANSLFADKYTVWGFKFGQRIAKSFSWFVEGKNLSNRNYAATTDVITNAGGVDSAQFLPGDGRAVFAGLEWKM